MPSSLEQRIEIDLKSALLAGDAQRVSTLRGLKSVLLNLKIASGARESGLTDDVVIGVLGKESKKRQESADMYIQGDSPDRAKAELAEKAIIDAYLPAQLSEAEVSTLVDEAIAETGATDMKHMGQVIAAVRNQAGASADGGLIARLVKEKLNV